jgi:hypothetical protein
MTDAVRARATITYECQCTCPPAMFRKWEDIPQDVRDMIPANGLPCDGGGTPGEWCKDCKWGKVEECDE